MTTALLKPLRPLAAGPTHAPLLQRLWTALEAMGARRAAAELNRQASLRVVADPTVGRHLRAAARRIESGL
jgi:hypothetical protein